MKDVEVYGKLLEEFIRKVTSPDIGQFRLEISTFRIILERERKKNPILNKFSISETGSTTNNLTDRDESLIALQSVLQRSLDFLSSLVGEELARDLVMSSMREPLRDLVPHLREDLRLLKFVPSPLSDLLKDMIKEGNGTTNHDEVLELFQDIFASYMKDLSAQTDLSALKLKLSILREKHRLLRHVEVKKNNTIAFEKDMWADAPDDEVREALIEAFNSMVGLSVFLVGKEEAMKKASRSLEYYFEGKEHLIKRYRIRDQIVNGSLNRRVSTGIDELDTRLKGGLPKGCSILLNAPSGIERDLLVARVLSSGLTGGSSALMVLSKEPPRSVRMLLRSQGVDPERMEEEGRLRLIDWFSWRGERIIGVEKEGHTLRSSKILSNLGIAINKGMRELAFSNSKIGIVHMIGPALNIFDLNQVYNFVQRLRAKFKDEEMASIFILEPETLTDEQGKRLLEVFDGQIDLVKSASEGTFRREMSVVSLSVSDFDSTPVPFIIKDNRLIVYEATAPPSEPPASDLVKDAPPPPPVRTFKEHPKPLLDVKRAPNEPIGQPIAEDAFEQLDEDSWLSELLEDDHQGVDVDREVTGPKAVSVKDVMAQPLTPPEPEPKVIKTSSPPAVEPATVRPLVKGRKLKKKADGQGDEGPPGGTGPDKLAKARPPPVRPRRIRRSVGRASAGRLTADPAALMEEIDISGTQSSPQKLLLDAIETIDQLLDESETVVQKGKGNDRKGPKS